MAPEVLWFFLGVSTAAAAIAVIVWIAYRSADRIGGYVGASARRTIARLSAFLLLCIGAQIMINGFEEVLTDILAARH